MNIYFVHDNTGIYERIVAYVSKPDLSNISIFTKVNKNFSFLKLLLDLRTLMNG